MGTAISNLVHDTHKAEQDDLSHAIRDANLEWLSQILHRHPELLKAKLDKEQGSTAMHIAVLERQREILSHLLSYETNISSTCTDKLEASLHHSAHKALNRGRTSDGATPLMLACDIGDEEAVRLLLQAGACPWRRDQRYHKTCVHYAAAKGHASCLRPIAEHTCTAPDHRSWHEDGVPNRPLVDQGTLIGFTPLMYAAWFNHAEAVCELLELGADFKTRCNGWEDTYCRGCHDGSSALHVAAVNGSQQAVRAILAEYIMSLTPEREALRQRQGLSRGPDPRLYVDQAGHTSFAVARYYRQFEVLAMLNPLTPLETLFDGENPEDRLVGVPPLKQIAAKVFQQQMLAQVEDLSKEIEEHKKRKAERKARRAEKEQQRKQAAQKKAAGADGQAQEGQLGKADSGTSAGGLFPAKSVCSPFASYSAAGAFGEVQQDAAGQVAAAAAAPAPPKAAAAGTDISAGKANASLPAVTAGGVMAAAAAGTAVAPSGTTHPRQEAGQETAKSPAVQDQAAAAAAAAGSTSAAGAEVEPAAAWPVSPLMHAQAAEDSDQPGSGAASPKWSRPPVSLRHFTRQSSILSTTSSLEGQLRFVGLVSGQQQQVAEDPAQAFRMQQSLASTLLKQQQQLQQQVQQLLPSAEQLLQDPSVQRFQMQQELASTLQKQHQGLQQQVQQLLPSSPAVQHPSSNHLLMVVSSLGGVMTETNIENTLAACRIHRLTTGVPRNAAVTGTGGTSSQGSSPTLSRTPSIMVTTQESFSSYVMPAGSQQQAGGTSAGTVPHIGRRSTTLIATGMKNVRTPTPSPSVSTAGSVVGASPTVSAAAAANRKGLLSPHSTATSPPQSAAVGMPSGASAFITAQAPSQKAAGGSAGTHDIARPVSFDMYLPDPVSAPLPSLAALQQNAKLPSSSMAGPERVLIPQLSVESGGPLSPPPARQPLLSAQQLDMAAGEAASTQERTSNLTPSAQLLVEMMLNSCTNTQSCEECMAVSDTTGSGSTLATVAAAAAAAGDGPGPGTAPNAFARVSFGAGSGAGANPGAPAVKGFNRGSWGAGVSPRAYDANRFGRVSVGAGTRATLSPSASVANGFNRVSWAAGASPLRSSGNGAEGTINLRDSSGRLYPTAPSSRTAASVAMSFATTGTSPAPSSIGGDTSLSRQSRDTWARVNAAAGHLDRAMSVYAASSLGNADEHDNICGVCLDSRDFISSQPCDHKICVDCAIELLKLHPHKPAPCPFCRNDIYGFKRYSKTQS